MTSEARVWSALLYPGVRLQPRRNSLNLIRLLLAVTVIASHSTYLGGYSRETKWLDITPGRWAVIGFFVISGYLITGSRNSHRFADYLTHRIARIYPGFIVTILVTVFVFAPVAYAKTHGTLWGYMTTKHQPLEYIVGNITMRMNVRDIAGTPVDVPHPGDWNGPLWTIYYEFACYLTIGFLLGVAVVRRRQKLVIPVLFVVSVALQKNATPLLDLTNGSSDVKQFLQLLPHFLAGATLYQLRDRLRYNVPTALACLGVVVWGAHALPGWGAQLTSPALGYFLLWLSTALPTPQIIREEDISYGMYTYAFQVQLLLAIAGAQAFGYVWYTLLAVACTVPLAVASWVLVERPMLRRARGTPSVVRAAPTVEPADAGPPRGSLPPTSSPDTARRLAATRVRPRRRELDRPLTREEP